MSSSELYHERQSLQFCALHCVNNLLQGPIFKKRDFDRIAYELTPTRWFNPHKSFLNTGNYDVNIIMKALKTKGYSVTWFDKRKLVEEIAFDDVVGLIINENKTTLLSLWNSRHWIAIPNLSGTFYNSNSILRSPVPFESTEKLIEYLIKLIGSPGEVTSSQLLLVTKDAPNDIETSAVERD